MIKFEGNDYSNEIVEVYWSKYTIRYMENSVSKIKEGISPYINIKFKNNKNENITFGIETPITEDELIKLKINEEVDISNYVTDIIFIKDEKDQPIYFEEDDFKVLLMKISDSIVNFKFYYKELNISFDGNIKLIR